jgi:hypothetical protein
VSREYPSSSPPAALPLRTHPAPSGMVLAIASNASTLIAMRTIKFASVGQTKHFAVAATPFTLIYARYDTTADDDRV